MYDMPRLGNVTRKLQRRPPIRLSVAVLPHRSAWAALSYVKINLIIVIFTRGKFFFWFRSYKLPPSGRMILRKQPCEVRLLVLHLVSSNCGNFEMFCQVVPKAAWCLQSHANICVICHLVRPFRRHGCSTSTVLLYSLAFNRACIVMWCVH